jgi:PKD repeat protein
MQVTVEEPPVEEPPVEEPPVEELTAQITSNATNGTAPATFEFGAEVAGGSEPYTIEWDFGDGSAGSDGESVVHTYEAAGTYTVTLTVTDSDEQEVSDTMQVTVEESAEEPPTQGGTDPFGVNELYPTASGGPTWYILEQEDPTDDGHFYLSMYRGTTIDYLGNGVWNVDATSGTQEHGIRMHVDSPTGTWKNTEMTGYFRANSGSDQFTMIARHGPSYHDDGGCHAYGYYGMTAIDGNVFFKKKLYHFNDGYTARVAQVDALDSLSDGRWIGMKFVVYDIPGTDDIKLELWIDDGDMTNNWEKVTEVVDNGGNLAVEGGDDCGRDASDQIESGTRVSYRADNMDFDFKKLSAREIQPPS